MDKCLRQLREAYDLLESSTSILYHMSPHVFDTFKAVDKHAFGKESRPQPIFFKASEEEAKDMHNVGDVLYTCKVDLGKLFDPTEVYDWDATGYTDDPEAITDLGKQILSEVFNGDYDSIFYLSSAAYDIVESSDMLNWLQSNGYDSFLVSEVGSLSRDKSIAVFDVNRIKIVKREKIR